jgi:hypothetical protein
MEFVIPNSITFSGWKDAKVTLTRTGEYCDLTQLQNNKNMNIEIFKMGQYDYLELMRVEVKKSLIITKSNKLKVHEKILERILRWFGVDEAKVIDKFVKPKTRNIGHYEYDQLRVLIHLQSQCINATKFCYTMGKYVTDWIKLKTVQNLFHIYCKKELKITPTGNVNNYVLKKGIGLDANDIWVPQEILPILAIWCSQEYALFTSKIMILFHKDPLKLAGLSVKEYDRQTGQHTVTILHSTDNKSEHDSIVKGLEKKIKHLNNTVYRVKYDNSLLSKDKRSLLDQAKPFFDMRDDHDMHDLTDLVLHRKALLDKHKLPLQYKIEQQTVLIDELKINLSSVREKMANHENMLQEIQDGHADDILYYEEVISEMSENKKPVNTKHKPKQTTKHKIISVPEITSITSSDPPASTYKISIYTKINYEYKEMAFIPGSCRSYKSKGYIFKGTIHMIKKYYADRHVSEFIDKIKDLCISSNQWVISLKLTTHFDHIEEEFNKLKAKFIVNKELPTKYKIKKNSLLCDF